MRERVHHPAGMRELLHILKIPRDERTASAAFDMLLALDPSHFLSYTLSPATRPLLHSSVLKEACFVLFRISCIMK